MHFSAGWPTGGTPLPPSSALIRSRLTCDSACNCAACWANTSAKATSRCLRVRFMSRRSRDIVYSSGLAGPLLPVELLLLLAAGLGFDGQRRGGTSDQPGDADGLAGFLAIAVT